MKKILVVGSLNMDFVIRVDAMPLAGQTVMGHDMTLVPGGKGANQAYAIGKLGGQVEMIGAVGNDVYGAALKENLESVGVGTSGIEVLDGVPTGNAFISVDRNGENSITVVPGANAKLTRAMIDRHLDLIDACDIVVMQLEIPLDVVTYVKDLARARGKHILLDPAPAQKGLTKEFFQGFDIVKPNETELQCLVGQELHTKEELTAGARTLLEQGMEAVLVTLGGDGVLLVTKQACEAFPAKKVKAVDTTAAGDSFTAAFVVACSKGASYPDAIRLGSEVAAVVVTRKGAQTSIPTLEEVQNL